MMLPFTATSIVIHAELDLGIKDGVRTQYLSLDGVDLSNIESYLEKQAEKLTGQVNKMLGRLCSAPQLKS